MDWRSWKAKIWYFSLLSYNEKQYDYIRERLKKFSSYIIMGRTKRWGTRNLEGCFILLEERNYYEVRNLLKPLSYSLFLEQTCFILDKVINYCTRFNDYSVYGVKPDGTLKNPGTEKLRDVHPCFLRKKRKFS